MASNRITLFCLLLFSGTASYGQSSDSRLSPSQIHRLDSVSCQDVSTGAPGIAAGIVKDGRIVYQKVAGFANLEDSSVITPDTRFNIASNGKQFTALAILLLVDEQKLALTDDIKKYLPEILPGLQYTVTIENLLTHSSGIRDVYDLWSLAGITWWEHSFNNSNVLDLLRNQNELNFKPGSKYLYSNSNYILLACIIEKVTGKPFVQYTKELFKKLDMPNTSFEDVYSKIQGPIAKAYFNFGAWTTYSWIWNVCGDGNIFSTLSDQLHWEQLLQGQTRSGLKQELLQKSQQLIDHSGIKNYGYGLEFGIYKGMAYKFHEGATGAWKATVIRFEGKNISFITLTNSGKATPDRQTRQMADIYFDLKDDESYIVTKPAKTGAFCREEDILGIYRTTNNFTFQFEKRDSVLYLKRSGRNDVKLEREAGNIFHQAYDTAFKQEFNKNQKGEMEVTAYYTTHQPYTLTRSNSNWRRFKNTTWNGKFINKETGIMLEISLVSDRNYSVKIGSGDETRGILISPVQLLADDYIIETGKTNSMKTVYLSGSRIQRIRFDRIK